MSRGLSKAGLLDELALRTGHPRSVVQTVMDALVTVAYGEAANGFVVPGLCKIEIVDRKPRRCRDPRTGAQLIIGARKAVRIRPVKKAKDVLTPACEAKIAVALPDGVAAAAPMEPAPALPPPPAAPVSEAAWVESVSEDDAVALPGEANVPGETAAAAGETFIYFACTGCGQEIEAPLEMAGSSAPCPRCDRDLQVPASLSQGATADEDEELAEMDQVLFQAMKKRTIRIELSADDLAGVGTQRKIVFHR